MITHVFDTSALLAHALDEPGADDVDALLGDPAVKAGVSVVTRVELWTRLHVMVQDEAVAGRAWRRYIEDLTRSHPVSERTAELAIELRTATPDGLPLVDSLIAATARELDAVLVHRDPHMEQIPTRLLNQRQLPARHPPR